MRHNDGYDDNPLIDWIVKSVTEYNPYIFSPDEQVLDEWLDGRGELTDRERKAVLKRLIKRSQKTMTIYGVYRNSDMTEGRGPMVLDSLFKDKEKAENYADSQLGVMGQKPQSGKWTNQKYGDWKVRELDLIL